MLVALAFAIILVLADSFDELAVGRILSLKRQLVSAEYRAKTAENLLGQVTQVTQAFTSTNTVAPNIETHIHPMTSPDQFSRDSEPEDEPLDELQAAEPENESPAARKNELEEKVVRHMLKIKQQRYLEQGVIRQECDRLGLPADELLFDIRLESFRSKPDPIGDLRIMVNGMVRIPKFVHFFEAVSWKRLLSTRNFYGILSAMQGIDDATPRLYVITYVDETNPREIKFAERRREQFREAFAPAIASGSLWVPPLRLVTLAPADE